MVATFSYLKPCGSSPVPKQENVGFNSLGGILRDINVPGKISYRGLLHPPNYVCSKGNIYSF